jgi:hypothetical protein
VARQTGQPRAVGADPGVFFGPPALAIGDQRRRARPRGELVTAGLIRAHRARRGVADARVLHALRLGILYDARVPGHDEHLVFGSSGFVYRSNKLMYDQAKHSLWSQVTGRPVAGPLTRLGIELAVLPVTIATWRDWRPAIRTPGALARCRSLVGLGTDDREDEVRGTPPGLDRGHQIGRQFLLFAKDQLDLLTATCSTAATISATASSAWA